MLDRVRSLAARLEAPRVRPVAVTVLVLALLVATASAFAVSERLKLERSPVAAPQLTRLIGPTCECPRDTAELRVRFREPVLVTASMVDVEGDHVRTLATELRRPRGPARFTWDGRTDRGEVVRDGLYRLRLALLEHDRTITIPTPVRVDTRPPRIRLLDVSPLVFSPDGDGRADRIRFRYRTSEAASAVIQVNGELAVRGRSRPAGEWETRWRGRLDGEPVPPGTYRVRLYAVDPAGNRSEPTRVVSVRVRYVELLRADRRAWIGGALRFRVDADARRVEYSLVPIGAGEGFGGTVEPGEVEVDVPRGLRPGRYVLRVSVGEWSERSLVRLVRR